MRIFPTFTWIASGSWMAPAPRTTAFSPSPAKQECPGSSSGGSRLWVRSTICARPAKDRPPVVLWPIMRLHWKSAYMAGWLAGGRRTITGRPCLLVCRAVHYLDKATPAGNCRGGGRRSGDSEKCSGHSVASVETVPTRHARKGGNFNAETRHRGSNHHIHWETSC